LKKDTEGHKTWLNSNVLPSNHFNRRVFRRKKGKGKLRVQNQKGGGGAGVKTGGGGDATRWKKALQGQRNAVVKKTKVL